MDVHALDRASTPEVTYICECKNWATPVTKTIVHGFRTVVADAGAHLGYIVSRSGFQSGAFAAAQNSNIRLVTWGEFQGVFLERWKEGRYEQLSPSFEELFEFFDYFCDPIGNAITGRKEGREERLAEFNDLIQRYSLQAGANPWNRMFAKPRFPPLLPLRASDTVTLSDYFTLFDWFEKQTLAGIAEFNGFVERYRTGPVGHYDD